MSRRSDPAYPPASGALRPGDAGDAPDTGPDTAPDAAAAAPHDDGAHHIRDKLIGLGERSMRKSYYPELQERLTELERFRSLLDFSTDAIFLVQCHDGRVADFNRSACRLLNLEPEALAGRPFAELLHPDMAGELRGQIMAGPAGGRESVQVARLRRFRGCWVPVEMSLRFADFGGSDYCAIVARDITERHLAEKAVEDMNFRLERLVEERTRELAAANRRLRELDDLKSAFLSSVSHELRTPLTSIYGFVRLIAKDFARYFGHMAIEHDLVDQAGRIQDNLRVVSTEGERLSRLIDDLLDLTRIESSRMKWRERLLQPAELAATAMASVRGSCQERRGPELRLELGQDLPTMHLDPDRMLQVLINLLDNAAKFTPQGVVTLSMAGTAEGGLHMRVRDSGVGIRPEDLEVIFQPFRQASQDSLKDKPKGTGLGLSICREIVEHYGGRIWAESEPGRGSVFHVLLPPPRCMLAEDEAAEAVAVSGDQPAR